MRTIRQQLLIWLLGGTLACSAIAGSALYVKVREEANELFDAQLKQVTEALPTPAVISPDKDDDNGPEENVVVQAWDQTGKLIYATTPDTPLPRHSNLGYQTVSIDGHAWRFYANNRQSMFIQAAQPMHVREKLAAKIALRSLFPFLVLIPVLALLIWIVVGRSLRPLNRLADAVGRRSAHALQPLAADGFPPEIKPVLDAMNDLLKQLDQALATQRAFVADAAHELRSPLTALKLQLQLSESATSDEQRSIAFHKLHDRLDRTSHLVHQLLTLARHEPGREEDRFEPIDMQRLAEQIVGDYYLLAESKQIDLGIDTHSVTQMVRGDTDGLRILLSNLVDNACRYTPKGGNVDISVLLIDGCPALRVTDNGPGISEGEKLRVFDRFYRGEDAATWGSGLGLAIVKNIADMHTASVTLMNTSPEGGLAVTVKFPHQ
ncbi:MAG TPA: ATP-binding protein [Burkholderiaceae bacterium]|jgi:two-component system OmpR family sensor kinase